MTTEELKVTFNNSKHFQKNTSKKTQHPNKKHPTNPPGLHLILAPVEFAPAIHPIDL